LIIPSAKKNELLDIVAHGNRQLVSRSVVSQTSSGWKEQRADLVDGDWKFIHSFSWIDTLENALVIYESYIQGDTLVSVRTLYEDTPNVRKRTNAKWINTSWVNQTRETAFYILNDMWVVDTLVFIEQWREENWKRRRLKRIILDDLYREQEASWYGWIDSVWVPEDGDMFIYSLDKSFAWSYYANSVIVHRSIDNSTGVTEHQLQVPKGFELHQNYPNPSILRRRWDSRFRFQVLHH
jgi:hypothetical protein